MPHLFVYGTLLPELAPLALAPRLARLRNLGTGTVRGRLYDLGAFPGLELDEFSKYHVVGEVLDVPDELLLEIDDYEGYDAACPEAGRFRRRRAPVSLTTGDETLCWVYVYNREIDSAPLIEHGDYQRWLREQ